MGDPDDGFHFKLNPEWESILEKLAKKVGASSKGEVIGAALELYHDIADIRGLGNYITLQGQQMYIGDKFNLSQLEQPPSQERTYQLVDGVIEVDFTKKGKS